MMITGTSGTWLPIASSSSRPLPPGMRMSDRITSGCACLSASSTLVAASKLRTTMPAFCSAFSSTQRID